MVEVFTARSGAPSARMRGVAIHSPYDPVREARRFVETSLAGEEPSAAVILGEGLGYLAECMGSACPATRRFCIFYSEEMFRESLHATTAVTGSGPRSVADAWHPGLGVSVEEFLRQRIGELDVEGLRVLEWPPSARLFPEQSRRANEALQGLLRELNGSLVTTMAMGRLWLRNTISNFLLLDGALAGAPCARRRAVVITASGPSLEESAPLLHQVRNAIDIWALPSSALLLRQAGLSPDLIVMTDPGFYAIHHLYHAPPGCPVAMPLSAARGLWTFEKGRTGPLAFLLEQPGFLEAELLRALGIPAPVVAPHGTVAASALDLARASTSGPVILAGLDLSANDVASHARPNEFETFYHIQSCRTSPYDGLWYRRSADMSASRIPGSTRARAPVSLRTYAGWRGWSRPGPAKVYRLLPSVVDLPGLTPLDGKSLREIARDFPTSAPGPHLSPRPFLSRAERTSVVDHVFSRWKIELEKGIAQARGKAGHRALASESLLNLVYQLSAAGVLETKRRARLRDEEGARQSALALLEESEEFLHALEERVQNAE